MFRGISLANKCLLLFGGAVVLIVVAALTAPWFRMNALVDQAQHDLSRQMLSSWIAAERQVKDAVSEARGDPGPLALPTPAKVRPGPNLLPETKRPGPDPKAPAEFAGVLARRIPIEQVRRETNDDRFLARALSEFTDNETSSEMAEARWRGSSREYRYAKAERVGEGDGKRLSAIVLLERRSVQATSLLLINSAYLAVAAVFVLALAILVFYQITHRIILSPVRLLRDTAEKVRQGDLTIRSDITTGDEFEELAQTFNMMLTDLELVQTQLRSINAALDLRMNELQASNSALFEAALMKGEFVASVSHELRTPLNSIIGFCDLLLEIAQAEAAAGDDSTRLQKRIRYLENILNAARNLLDMINSLLEMAKIEAGKVDLRIEKVAVKPSCEALAGLIFPLADKKGIQIKMEMPDDLPLIETDQKKLQQIVFNFLSNAVKFTPAAAATPGADSAASISATDTASRIVRVPLVTLRAEKLSMSGPGTPDERIRISVIDSGPGIPPDEQTKIFEKFHQISGGHTREHAGTGLGLAISKELASVLQGEIQVVSEIGRGSMFSLILPLTFDSERARNQERPGALAAAFSMTRGR
ncbi:MAG: HAMP domain-containing sensor histidine kinase [Planctomycetota bacterium]|nr:HAMP domain-containing sensor histidine kinase [Planctomycetota bacterium]